MKSFELKECNQAVFLQLPILTGARHAFGTSQEGEGVLATFALSPQQLLTLRQVHGAEVLIWKGSDNPEVFSHPLIYDAAITDREGIALGIWTADCIPILMLDGSKGVVAAVHAGWRGLWRGIVQRVISKMKEAFGSSTQDILVGIGPGISPCCYEVGKDVLDLFRSSQDDCHLFIQERGGRSYLDLCCASRLQLVQMGVPPENIDNIPLCTACRQDLFYSYRRDKGGGKQLSFIMLG